MQWACQCVGLWPPVPSLDPGQLAWVDGCVEAVEPFTSPHTSSPSSPHPATAQGLTTGPVWTASSALAGIGLMPFRSSSSQPRSTAPET